MLTRAWLSLALALIGLLAVSALAPTPPMLAQPASVCGPNPSPVNPADPSLLVSEPTAGQRGSSPLTIAGRARVFEAVVSVELRSATGAVLARTFLMASAGAPALAPFHGTLAFSVSAATPACLWVFEASARDGSPRNVAQVPLTLLPGGRYVAAALDLSSPCIPAAGADACDAGRRALWNGEAAAWAARGVANADARFNETVVFRVVAGDPGAIRNIARLLGWPYVKITELRFGAADEYVEITNLGGGAQDVTGWLLDSVDRNVGVGLRLTLAPGQTCRVAREVGANACGLASFGVADVWPDAGGRVSLFAAPLNLSADETVYRADPARQPPPPHLQGVGALVTDPPAAGPLRLTLALDRAAYAPGQPVQFTLTLTNVSDSVQPVSFASGQEFDVVVLNANGDAVWRWSAGRVFTQATRLFELQPGEERTYRATWNQRTDSGVAAVGPYQARAFLATRQPVTSNTVDFRIEPARTP